MPVISLLTYFSHFAWGHSTGLPHLHMPAPELVIEEVGLILMLGLLLGAVLLLKERKVTRE